jgi:hypothetical protein
MPDGRIRKVTVRWKGREITDPAQLPPHLRKLMEDADGDGLPDLAAPGTLAGLPEDDLEITTTTVESTKFEIDGKTYHSVDELPPELRQLARDAFSELLVNGQPVAAAQSVRPLDPTSSSRPLESTAPPKPVGSSWAVVLLAVMVGAIAMYLVLRPHH